MKKKILSFFLMFTILLTSLPIHVVIASDTCSYCGVEDSEEHRKTFTHFCNANGINIKSFKNYVLTGMGVFFNSFSDASHDLHSKFNEVWESTSNPATISDGQIVLSADFVSLLRAELRKYIQPQMVYINSVSTGADLRYTDFYGLNVSAFKYSSSASATYQFLAKYGGAFDLVCNDYRLYFTAIDLNIGKYAYLDGSKYVVFTDKNLETVNAYICKDSGPLTAASEFTYNDLVEDSANYRVFGTRGNWQTPLIFDWATNGTRTPYYGKPFKCFTSMDNLLAYVYGSSAFYITSRFDQEFHDLNLKIDDLSQYTDVMYQRLYDLISEKLKSGVDLEQLQAIIDSLVSDELKKLGLQLEDIESDMQETNEKLDVIINELKQILDTLGLFYEIDSNGNVTIKTTNINLDFDVDFNTLIVIPIIDKLAEINNSLTLEFSKQTAELTELTNTVNLIRLLLLDMSESQSMQYDLLAEKFEVLFEKLDNLKLEIDLTETNQKLDDIKQSNEDFFKQQLNDNKDIISLLNKLLIVSTADLMHDIFGDDDDPGGTVGGISNSFTISELLKNKFPFSAPWDIYLAFHVFAHEPVCPDFDIPLRLNVYDQSQVNYLHLDGSQFQWISDLSRTIFTISFAVALLLFTTKYIQKK